jgi:hypothetical protein
MGFGSKVVVREKDVVDHRVNEGLIVLGVVGLRITACERTIEYK